MVTSWFLPLISFFISISRLTNIRLSVFWNSFSHKLLVKISLLVLLVGVLLLSVTKIQLHVDKTKTIGNLICLDNSDIQETDWCSGTDRPFYSKTIVTFYLGLCFLATLAQLFLIAVSYSCVGKCDLWQEQQESKAFSNYELWCLVLE